MKNTSNGFIILLIMITAVLSSGCTFSPLENSSILITKNGTFLITPDNSSSTTTHLKHFLKEE